MAPLRAEHQAELRRLAAWALSAGRSADLDVAAACLASLADRRGAGGVLLDRPTVNWIQWGGVRNVVSALRTWMPQGWNVHLWTVLVWLDADGRLDPAGDPLPVLLEPLRCAGGLDADGEPMPEGVDVDFPCQCYLPHDPTLPPGLANHVVATDPESLDDRIVRIRPQLRTEEASFASYRPLLQLDRRLRADLEIVRIEPLDWTFVGVAVAARSTPELWLYRHIPTTRRGFDALALDADGEPWVTVPDRRRRSGFRWTRTRAAPALARAGRMWEPPPETSWSLEGASWADDGELLDTATPPGWTPWST